MEEFISNQKYILDAVKNLNERLLEVEERLDDEKMKDIKEIIEGQALIDEVIVKNADDIKLMTKVKNQNENELKRLEFQINALDQEIKEKIRDIESRTNDENKVNEKPIDAQEILCKYHNRGICKRKAFCKYKHAQNICNTFLSVGKCLRSNCPSRHPKTCRYQRQGCYRGEFCAFLHSPEIKDDHQNSIENRSDETKVDHEMMECINYLVTEDMIGVEGESESEILETSTPLKYYPDCEDCTDNSNCVKCIIRNIRETDESYST